MTRQEALPLRIAFAVLALGALLVQLLVIPPAGTGYAGKFPEAAYLAPPYITALAVAILGFEAALLAAWQLVSAVVPVRSLTRRSKTWTNVMAASLGFMAVVFAGVCAHSMFWTPFGTPAAGFGFLISLALIPVLFALRHGVLGWLEADVHDRVPR